MLWDVFLTTSFLLYWAIPLVPSRKNICFPSCPYHYHFTICYIPNKYWTKIENKYIPNWPFNSSSFSNQRVDRMKTSINAKSITLGKKMLFLLSLIALLLITSRTKVWLWGLWYDIHFLLYLESNQKFHTLGMSAPTTWKSNFDSGSLSDCF